MLFFGPIGLGLYLLTARSPGIGNIQDMDEEKKHHDEWTRSSPFRTTTGSVIHCVGGDGVGIITAMVPPVWLV